MNATLTVRPSLPVVACLGLSTIFGSAADDPRLEARKKAREAAVQSAGIDKALSKEMPDEVKALPVFGEIEWTVKELPFIPKGPHGGISGAGMVVVDGKIYLAGGFIPEGDGTQETGYRTSRWAHRYDPATDQWTQLPDLPARREYTRAIATDDAVFVLGGAVQGRPAQPSADVFRLDVGRTPLAWQTVTPLQVARTHHSVGKIGNQLVVAGGNKYDFDEHGYSGATILGSTEVFDLHQPEKGWVKRAPIPGVPRGWSATSVAGGKFFMLGGVTFHGSGKAVRAPRSRLQEALSYDPARDEWKRLVDFPFAISGWAGATYDERYIIAIGGAGTRWNDVPFVYDTKADRWMRITSPLPPGAVFNDPGVCIIGDTMYVDGGEGAGGSHFNHFLIGKIIPRPESGRR
jgi:N-acetylneuraminic acid mutarotase